MSQVQDASSMETTTPGNHLVARLVPIVDAMYRALTRAPTCGVQLDIMYVYNVLERSLARAGSANGSTSPKRKRGMGAVWLAILGGLPTPFHGTCSREGAATVYQDLNVTVV